MAVLDNAPGDKTDIYTRAFIQIITFKCDSVQSWLDYKVAVQHQYSSYLNQQRTRDGGRRDRLEKKGSV